MTLMNLQKNLLSAKRELTYCSICGRLTDEDPCSICTDPSRDQTTILVLEDSRDVAAMENIQEYHGLYHVLHGLISPMNGISPDDINLKSLMTRLMDSEVSEVIVATMRQLMVKRLLCISLDFLNPRGLRLLV